MIDREPQINDELSELETHALKQFGGREGLDRIMEAGRELVPDEFLNDESLHPASRECVALIAGITSDADAYNFFRKWADDVVDQARHQFARMSMEEFREYATEKATQGAKDYAEPPKRPTVVTNIMEELHDGLFAYPALFLNSIRRGGIDE